METNCAHQNRELCEYRLRDINKKLDDLSNDLKDLHKTVRNGVTEKIGEAHTKIETQQQHIRMHWWFISGLLLSIGTITFFVSRELFTR